MITPSYLQPGDKIIIVSPAGKVNETYILPAVKWLEGRGYRIELGENIFASHFQYAGTDSQRCSDMQKALDDKDAKAIICSRGGYGTVRIINRLDFSTFMNHPKWIIGFSDITIMHACLNNRRVATIHGVMPKYFFDIKGSPNESLITLMKILTGEKVSYTIRGSDYNRPGKISAELTGGNLSIISSMFGTCCELNSKGKILFIEDVDEFLYHADRMMYQLNMSGKLSKLAGLVIGNFTDMKDNESPFGKTIHEIISEAAGNYNYPVCFGFPAGHDEKNLALVFGKKWEIDISKKRTTLTLL